MEADPSNLAWQAAATSAINEGQRLFAFLTLTLEATRPLDLTPGITFYHMLDLGWDDWIVPLRVRLVTPQSDSTDAALPGGVGGDAVVPDQPAVIDTLKTKLRPTTLNQMAAEDAAAENMRYGVAGWDLFFLNLQPTAGQQALITYARSPVDLVGDNAVPEIHDADHECLIDYGEGRLRMNQGGQEMTTGSALIKGFLEDAKERGEQVRVRSLAQGYDHQPAELDLDQLT